MSGTVVGEHAAAVARVHELEAALDAAPSTVVSRRDVPPELLARSTVPQLLRMSLEEWAMIAVLCAVVILAPWWTYPIVLVPLAGRYHALGVILHDAAHMGSRSTTGRRVLEVLCGLPLATTLAAMRYHHLRHHRDSGMSTDPYFKDGEVTWWWWIVHTLRGALLFPFWTIRALVGVAALGLPSLRNAYARVFLQDRSGLDLREAAEVIACARAEVRQVAFQVAVAIAIVRAPGIMLWCYLLPVILASVISARRLLIEHHYESVADRRAETIMATTRDNHLGWLGAFVLAPRNVGYHVVHHLHPQASLVVLPRLRAWYEARYPGSYPVG